MFNKHGDVLTCPGTASDMKRVWAAGLAHPRVQAIKPLPVGVPGSTPAPFPPLIQVQISRSAAPPKGKTPSLGAQTFSAGSSGPERLLD